VPAVLRERERGFTEHQKQAPAKREGSLAGAFSLVRKLNTANQSLFGCSCRKLSAVCQFSFLIIFATFFAACSANRSSSQPVRTVTDELGRSVAVSIRPQRIISLAPSVTEILYALGAADRIAGVTSYCDYPPEARQKPIVGDTLKPSAERIIGLNADLVIISTASQIESIFQKLVELGIPVYVSNPRNIEGVIDSINRIGELIDARDQANELIQKLRARIANVQSRVAGLSRPEVFVILGTEPLITVGAGSFMTDLITSAGGRSISAEDPGDYPQYSIETVVARQPEVILLQSGEERLTNRLQQTPAGISNRVYHIDDDLLLRPGPRIVDGLEQVAAKLHPE
jgi:cobalamin transport system substrate-binding protein